MVFDFVMKILEIKGKKINCIVLYVGSNDVYRIYVVFNGGQNFVGEKESFCDLESVT
jgi:hypothetical protein